VDERQRHLELYRGHMMAPNATDLKFITPAVIERGTTTGTRDYLARHLKRLEKAGATAIMYQPAGSDIPRELRAFRAAAALRHEVSLDALQPQPA
jgi:5,10-methylenetetrahydromethanopterin reductase